MHITRHGFHFKIHIPSGYEDTEAHCFLHSPVGDIEVNLTIGPLDWYTLSISQTIGTFTVRQVEPKYKELGRSHEDEEATVKFLAHRRDPHVVIALRPTDALTFNPDQKLSCVFVNHLELERFIDITLKTPDKALQIHAHRALLAYYTPYFESALNFQNSGSKLTIQTEQFQLYSWVMDFIYYGRINETLDYDTMLELYKLAHYLDLKQMLSPVAWFVVDKFDPHQKDDIEQAIEWEPYSELQWEMCRRFNWPPNEKFKGHPGILYILLCHKQEIEER